MAEVTGGDLRDHGLDKKQVAMVAFHKALTIFGRTYRSIFKQFVSGLTPGNSEHVVGSGTLKKVVALKPITLDAIKFRGGQVQTDLEFKGLNFTEKIIRASQYGAIFALDDKQRVDWLFRMLVAINKAFDIGAEIACDRSISSCLTQRLPVIEVAGPETGTRAITPKDTPTIMKTNYVYRDGDWTNNDADQFTPQSVHKIYGFFLDKKCGYVPPETFEQWLNEVTGNALPETVYMQLTPTARNMLAKTEQGEKMLDNGGIHGNPLTLRFVNTPHDLVSGNFITDNTNVASAYNASTNRITLAARKIKDRNTDDDRVLFPLNQNMGDTQLNGLNDVAANSFENIEVQPDNVLGIWSSSAISFGMFNQLSMMQAKSDIRLKNAFLFLKRLGIGSVVNNENKVMLFPIRGKNL